MSDTPLPLENSDAERKPAPAEALFPAATNGVTHDQMAAADGCVNEPAIASAAPPTNASRQDGSAPHQNGMAATPSAPELNGSAVDDVGTQPKPDVVLADTPIVSDAISQIGQPPPSLAAEPMPPLPAEPPPPPLSWRSPPPLVPEPPPPLSWQSLPPLAAEPPPPPLSWEPPPPPLSWGAPPASEPPPPTFAAAPAAEASEPPAGHVPPPAEIVLEVSPIFSALDAAEQAAGEVRPNLPPAPAAGPADFSILLPQQPHLIVAQPVAPDPVSVEPVVPVAPAVPDPEPAFEPMPEPEAFASAAEPEQEQDQEQPTELLHDAAAKIAEEANATAEALESLKRLLNQKLPLLDTAPIDNPAPAPPPPMARAAASLSIPDYQLPAQVRPPPMVPLTAPVELAPLMAKAPPHRRSSLGGFFAGFALSWLFGAMLYVYLTLG